MRPSNDRLADDNDGVRASDAERDHAIGELQSRFAEGRLSQQTFLYRIDAALNAKDRNELSELFTDLPTQKRRTVAERLRERLTLLRMAVTGRPDPSTRLLNAPKIKLGQQETALPPLPLPPQNDRRFTIGRAMACDFTLADLSVSRWHARIYQEDEHWLLSDLGSTNGTRLNGWRVTTGVPVKPGDQVTFGSITFVITDRPPGLDVGHAQQAQLD
ncbi:MAG: DUF1707 domain-containing protein [Nocardiopsaceae bacterium]|jgi:hypothetical protein|nr:DUF1707 domain-containing protein [Nocardiopsaceae bacterium]